MLFSLASHRSGNNRQPDSEPKMKSDTYEFCTLDSGRYIVICERESDNAILFCSGGSWKAEYKHEDLHTSALSAIEKAKEWRLDLSFGISKVRVTEVVTELRICVNVENISRTIIELKLKEARKHVADLEAEMCAVDRQDSCCGH